MPEIYEATKKVIESRDYELEDLLNRIDVLFIEGRYTEAQRTELYEMARTNANPVNSLGTYDEIIMKLNDAIDNHESRLLKLEGITPVEYTPFEQGKIYRQGDKITFTDGERYEMVLPGEVAVGPDVYPDAWKKVEQN